MPGALISTLFLSAFLSIGPFPSIGLPNPSTTRPNKDFPTATSTIDPVLFTISPSLIFESSPKITTPTFSVSRFKAIPFVPSEN